MLRSLLLVVATLHVDGFSVPPNGHSLAVRTPSVRRQTEFAQVGRRQGRPVARARVQMGLFGLGVPEIAVILGIAGFVLGPEKLTEMAKDLGKVAGELKEVPKEFAEGMKESEAEATKAVPPPKVDDKATKVVDVDEATK